MVCAFRPLILWEKYMKAERLRSILVQLDGVGASSRSSRCLKTARKDDMRSSVWQIDSMKGKRM